MTDLDDFDLANTQREELDIEEPPPDPSEPEGSGWGLRAGIAAGLLLIAGALVAVFMLVFRHPAPKPAPSAPPSTVSAPRASAAPAVPVPPLEGSDAFVRDLAKSLSSHPQLALWLGAKELARTFAAVVDNVAAGSNPAPHLSFLAPKEPFAVLEKRGRTVIDLRSYARWDAFAEGVAAIDAVECARVFGLLEPLLEAAWRELGHPEPFRKGVEHAAAALLAVPVIEAEVPVTQVVRAVRVYEYADPKLEALTPAQKQLFRMGPANVARIQAKVREVLAALAPGPGGDRPGG
ncbi:MAG: DUF3014 domain-containing protein [Solirubrobacterales bacterium]